MCIFSIADEYSKFNIQRKRVILNKKSLSPCCAKLHQEYVTSRRQLEFNKRARGAMKFTKEKSFEKLTKNMNTLSKKILWKQIQQCTRHTKGRR